MWRPSHESGDHNHKFFQVIVGAWVRRRGFEGKGSRESGKGKRESGGSRSRFRVQCSGHLWPVLKHRGFQLILGKLLRAARGGFRTPLINRRINVECRKRQLPLLPGAERFARHQEAKASVASHLGMRSPGPPAACRCEAAGRTQAASVTAASSFSTAEAFASVRPAGFQSGTFRFRTPYESPTRRTHTVTGGWGAIVDTQGAPTKVGALRPRITCQCCR